MKSLLVKLGVILIIGLAIFSYVEVCRAEGAWVLWENLGIRLPSFGKPDWSGWKLERAYPTYEMCIKEANYRIKTKSASRNKTEYQIEIRSDGFMAKKSDDDWTFYEVKCFPDTVDPRK
jgi:hypothetical protein